MSKKILALAATGVLAVSAFAPTAQAATKKTTKKTTAKVTATTKAPATTAAPAATAAPATTAAAAKVGAGKKGGTLVNVGTFSSGDPTTAGDPALSSVVNESQMANMLFDGLMDIDYATGELKNDVAESYTLSPSGTVVTFKLKKGVKFSNNEDVLPSSFKCSWERTLNPAMASPLTYHLESIVGAEDVEKGKAKEIKGVVADDANLTLTVNLTAPYADFIAETQHTVFSPMTKDGCKADRTYHDGLIIGNGPFKMAEPWKRGQYIKMVRNDGYFGGISGHGPYLDGVEFKIVKDELAALSVFESGNADITGTTAGRFTELTKKYGDKAASRNQLVIQYVGFNWEDPVVGGFANAKLRQAISLAVNRKQLNESVFDGSRKEATGFTPPGIAGVKPDAYGLDATPNVAKAKQLLAEWGKPVPDSIKMRLTNTPASIQIGSVIRNAVKDIGIDITLVPEQSTGFFDRLRENSGQMYRAGWAADFVGYDNFMQPLWSTGAIGGDNLARFGNSQVDNLIATARTTSDATKRAALYQQAEKIIMDQGAVVPLYWNKWSTILSSKVDADRYALAQGPTSFVDYNEVSLK